MLVGVRSSRFALGAFALSDLSQPSFGLLLTPTDSCLTASQLLLRLDAGRADLELLAAIVREIWWFGVESFPNVRTRVLLTQDAPLVVDDLLSWPTRWAAGRLQL